MAQFGEEIHQRAKFGRGGFQLGHEVMRPAKNGQHRRAKPRLAAGAEALGESPGDGVVGRLFLHALTGLPIPQGEDDAAAQEGR